MELNAYSILDEKSGTYDRPIFATTHAVAMRAFGDACKDPNHPMAKHPEDYRLYHLGDFNQITGEMNSNPKPTFLASATEFARPTDNGLNEAGKHFITQEK